MAESDFYVDDTDWFRRRRREEERARHAKDERDRARALRSRMEIDEDIHLSITMEQLQQMYDGIQQRLDRQVLADMMLAPPRPKVVERAPERSVNVARVGGRRGMAL